MKYTNLIKLLSVLLCAMMLFTACASFTKSDAEGTDTLAGSDTETDATTDTSTETGAPEVEQTLPGVLGPVDPVLNNFFKLSTTKGWKDLGAATRLDGECISYSEDGSLVVFRTANIDHMNNVTEKFSVYNFELGFEILSFVHVYSNGNYAEFDWNNIYMSDPELKFPADIMNVEVLEAYGGVNYIKVSRATITPIDEETFEENEGNSHVVVCSYEYYDVTGQLITKTAIDVEPEEVICNEVGRSIAFSFGGVIATFDKETGAILSTVGTDNKTVYFNYDEENVKYGYYFGLRQYSALTYKEYFFEVYNKEDNTLALRYYMDPSKGVGSTFLLASGDVIVQYMKAVDKDLEIPYDVVVDGTRYQIATYLVSVPTGMTKQIECKYLLGSVMARETFINEFDAEAMGIELTDKALNIAIGISMPESKIDTYNIYDILVLDNDGSLMYKFERFVPEHIFSDVPEEDMFGFVQLENGDFLVDIADLATTQAIVTPDGKVRSYLKPEAVVVGEAVVLSDGIYDYDLNRLYDFEAAGYTFRFAIGNNIIVSYESFMEDGVTAQQYYSAIRVENGVASVTSVFRGAIEGEAVRLTNDFVIVKNAESGKYSLYNANLEHILTTLNTMSVVSFEDYYMVATQLPVNGTEQFIFYTVPVVVTETVTVVD